jgi:hypothetical protein
VEARAGTVLDFGLHRLGKRHKKAALIVAE